VSIVLDNRLFMEQTDESLLYIGWRGLHLQEGGRGAPVGMPAVLPPIETRALPMIDRIQRMSYNLARYFAPSIDGRKWRAMHGDTVAMNNGAQNGFGTNPHRDVINLFDTNSEPPRYDKMQRTFAGTFIRGDVVGDQLYCTPGIHGIDATRTMPDIETILKNNWYVIACTSGDRIWNFPQGDGSPVVYPFIFDRVISFPLQWFGRWERAYLPNHLTVYS
jgi:hypothetical protein